MSEYGQFLLLGVGGGAAIAVIALGLVLIYRASGVVHFGYGAVATYVAYVYASLRDDGTYPVPPLPNPLALVEGVGGLLGWHVSLPDLPTFIQVSEGDSGAVVAVSLSLGTAVAVGLLSHFLVFRPLRYAPDLAKIVASLGIMLTLLAAIVLRFGSGSIRVPDLLPSDAVSIAGVRLPQDRLWLLLIVAVLTAALVATFRYTRFGIATRAAAENERLATLRGISADFQAAVTWVLASVLAGLVGILVSQISGLSPMRLTLLVIPALGAALMAGFASFSIAALTGLLIGMTQSVLTLVDQRFPSLPDINLPNVLPFLVIAAAMLLRGEALPSRGSVTLGRLPAAPAWRIRPGITIGAVAVVALIVVLAPYPIRTGLNNSMIGMILALSLVVVTGYVGQVSLAQMTLAGIAAFGVGTFATAWGLSLIVALPMAIAAATAFGVLLSLPALRTRGASLAVITLAAAVAIQSIFLERNGWFGSRTQGEADAPTLLGWNLGTSAGFPIGDGKIPSPAFGLLLLGFSVAAVLFVVHLRNSRLGEQMLAVRANERAAAAAGVDVVKIKIAAFAFAGALAGLGGAMKAFQLGTFSADSFSVLASLTLLAFAYLGGISTVGGSMWAGALVAGGIATVLSDRLVDLGEYEAYVAGIVLIATAVTSNEGIDGANRALVRRLRSWRRSRRPAGSPEQPPAMASQGVSA